MTGILCACCSEVFAMPSSIQEGLYVVAAGALCLQGMKQLMFDILTGQKRLASAWNPALEQGAIMVRGQI